MKSWRVEACGVARPTFHGAGVSFAEATTRQGRRMYESFDSSHNLHSEKSDWGSREARRPGRELELNLAYFGLFWPILTNYFLFFENASNSPNRTKVRDSRIKAVGFARRVQPSPSQSNQFEPLFQIFSELFNLLQAFDPGVFERERLALLHRYPRLFELDARGVFDFQSAGGGYVDIFKNDV